jgi:choline dehydrogenase-like flavoprotein
MINGSIMLTKSPQEHIRTNTTSSWHMSGTAKMGRNAEDSCVDSRFRVFGLDALRVVDMSVAPFVPRYVKVNANEEEYVLIVP